MTGDGGERQLFADVIANEADRATKAALLVRLDRPLQCLVHIAHHVAVRCTELAHRVGGLGSSLERGTQLVEALLVESAARQERFGKPSKPASS